MAPVGRNSVTDIRLRSENEVSSVSTSTKPKTPARTIPSVAASVGTKRIKVSRFTISTQQSNSRLIPPFRINHPSSKKDRLLDCKTPRAGLSIVIDPTWVPCVRYGQSGNVSWWRRYRVTEKMSSPRAHLPAEISPARHRFVSQKAQ